MTRQAWITHGEEVSVAKQCELAAVSRATVYAHQRPKPVDKLGERQGSCRLFHAAKG